MKRLRKILENSLLAQVSLEERLYKEVERQLSHSSINQYGDVKEMLHGVKEVLERHYARLNLALDQVTAGLSDLEMPKERDSIEGNNNSSGRNRQIRQEQISQMLHEDYAALNLAAMGNSLLHTTALAAESKEIADIALEHLANLNHYVHKMSELMPRVVAQELAIQFPDVKLDIGSLAAQNTREVYRGHKVGENELNQVEED